MFRFDSALRFFFAFILTMIFAINAYACTRVLYNKPGQPVLVGNNMDWYDDTHTQLNVYPAGIARNGMTSGSQLKWKAKYGSIAATEHGSLNCNGMNEQGLGVHCLGLDGADYGQRDERIPGLSVMLWVQFYLDNFQTVAEAVQFTQTRSFQVVAFDDPQFGNIPLHFALDDASGDSAIIEYIDGKPRIYHDSKYTVLTNEPTFDVQLENLKQYSGLGGDKPLPGTTYPIDRFVRAAYYVERLPDSKTTREAVLRLMSVMQNAGQPFGIATPERAEGGHIYESLWHSISDLTHHVYYFSSTMGFNMFWVQLDKFNLLPGSPVMTLELESHPDLAGDVTGAFKAVD